MNRFQREKLLFLKKYIDSESKKLTSYPLDPVNN